MSRQKLVLIFAVLALILGGLTLAVRPSQDIKNQAAKQDSQEYHQINSQIIGYLFASYNTDYKTFTGKEGFQYLTGDAQTAKLAGLEEETKLVKEQKLSNKISDIKIHEINFGQVKGEASAKVSFEIKQLKAGIEQSKATVMDQLKLKYINGLWLIDDEVGQLQKE